MVELEPHGRRDETIVTRSSPNAPSVNILFFEGDFCIYNYNNVMIFFQDDNI